MKCVGKLGLFGRKGCWGGMRVGNQESRTKISDFRCQMSDYKPGAVASRASATRYLVVIRYSGSSKHSHL
ncbi:hypothetical protein AU378_20115 [Chryseobacterium kwangjuense]|uniref:Uncharacterized protein n=1 Tax=Chryseobacterium kwangjuense TaxID=267125 RepID=A0A135W418_9FLAO|nr:hypothetical protein AU378_20115 [Chryseobacterium kwangjuense]